VLENPVHENPVHENPVHENQGTRMKLPQNLRYTESHEWVRPEPDGTAAVGITDHAQEQLGDIVFVEAPKPGRKVQAGEAVGVVESVKAASDIYAPVSGEIVAVNPDLSAAPEQVNADAYAAWMYRIRPDDAASLDGLLDAAAYEKTASA
jgi:glycine cleavage system H protein